MPDKPGEISRDEWCRTRKPSTTSAVFQPGQTMRCPLGRVMASGRRIICGGNLGHAPTWVREAVVRAVNDLPPIANSEAAPRTCDSCRKMVEVFYVRPPPATALEATG